MDLVYTNPRAPGSFGGVETFRRHTGKPRKDVLKYLAGQDAYTMHKPSRRRFPRQRTYSKGIDDQFQIDLADMSNLSAYNDGYRYLLNCIDVFTKHAWSVPLKTKTGREVSNAFERHVLSSDGVTWYSRTRELNFSILPSSPCCTITVQSFTRAKTRTSKPLSSTS